MKDEPIQYCSMLVWSCVLFGYCCIGLQIVGSELRTAVALNYEQQRTYSITVRSYDNGSPALYVDQVFTIRVIDVNERPSALNTTTMYINENSPLNAFIGVMVGIDPDNFRQSGRQTLTYSLIDSANDLFKLDQDILRVGSFAAVSHLQIPLQMVAIKFPMKSTDSHRVWYCPHSPKQLLYCRSIILYIVQEIVNI